MIKNAMVFAAGFGARMQNHTRNVPKPLLKVRGQHLIDIVTARLIEYGVDRIVVNCHYLAQQIITHLKGQPKITISHEKEILETGGGLVKALEILGNEHLITVNADTIWYERDLLLNLTELWKNHSQPDLAMTFYDARRMIGHRGEFDILNDNSVIKNNTKFVYAGIQIINPKILQLVPKKYFSLSEVHNLLLSNKSYKICGMEYSGNLFHVGSAKELASLNEIEL